MVQVFAPRGGPTGLIATLAKWGMTIIDVVSGAGAITKYTVGPAWTGAEFATIQAAVNQAVIDGHSTPANGSTILFELYSTWFTENVVVPETLPRWVMRGAGADDTGTSINGTLTINLPGAQSNVALESVEVFGVTTVNQPVRTSNNVFLRLDLCSLFGAFVVNSATAIGVAVRCNTCDIVAGLTATCRAYVAEGGRLRGNCTVVTGLDNVHSEVEIGTSTANVWNFQSTTAFSRLYNCVPIFGRVNFSGVSCAEWECYHGHAGSPAVADACTVSSFCQGNTYGHDAGAAGPVWVQSGAALFHDGGNTFCEGQTYPWFQVGVGGRTDRAESDNELRRVLTLAGSPVLTPAEVGSQRKTTVAKVDGGGVVTLPLASQVEPGCTVVVKDLNGSATASPFTVAPQGADLIDGGVVPSISTNYGAITFQQMSATDWGIIGRYL